MRKVAEERAGQLIDALLDPNQDDVVRRQIARVFSIGVSQRAVDGLLAALDDERFGVRYQAARSLAHIIARNPRVRIDREALSSVDLGARIVFELPDGTRHVALVERLVVHDNGDRTWSGHLAGSGIEHPVVYTQGELWTFATLVTPQGLYALEAEGEEGVLFKDGREAMQRDPDGCALLPE